jgi:hypothetical protein
VERKGEENVLPDLVGNYFTSSNIGGHVSPATPVVYYIVIAVNGCKFATIGA